MYVLPHHLRPQFRDAARLPAQDEALGHASVQHGIQLGPPGDREPRPLEPRQVMRHGRR
eukprot:CAMPEP_0179266074 /NCGR_PEP_ID=MMETSP0797-20121207/29228_1 /TAXON_ID=47934 /ORGANISM="Dinophysis acuminata, Strain DAEP01" /LENGTH=58 /DNA_ID=CAMNT_0020974295 /DNA_START=243 /DNA_END=416 /DNA_ORIENTATION=-